MPGTESQGSFLNRISIRRNQIASIDNNDQDQEDYEIFLKHVSDRFSALLPAVESPCATHDAPPLLTIAWFHELLDAFLGCEAEFKAILIFGRDPSQFSRPPLDRVRPDLLEKSVKALDVFNAVTNGLDLVHHWQKLGQIAVSALRQSPVGEGQVRRARKALSSLLTSMSFDDKENSHGKWTERTKSFGRRIGGSVASKERSVGNLRSLSWSVAKSWSSAKQVQIMLSSLGAAPRGAEAAGLALPIYIFNTILVFVVWAMVTAVPCQERSGLTTHFQIPKNSGWAQPIMVLQERIGEEWKKREKEKRGTAGLLEELQRMEKVAHSLVEFADAFVFPLEDEKAAELAAQVEELAEVCRKMEEGLVPLQQQVREVFHRIVKSRGEILDVLDQVSKLSAAVQY